MWVEAYKYNRMRDVYHLGDTKHKQIQVFLSSSVHNSVSNIFSTIILLIERRKKKKWKEIGVVQVFFRDVNLT